MASLSSNSFHASKNYDVFISFRGADTRHNFISHLRSALSRNSIKACIDYDLLGESDNISVSLKKSIEDSYGSVIVFSENYASSKWCLRELVKILECRKEGHFVIPVFYNVKPSQVRHQTASYGEALARHKYNSENRELQLWRAALTEASNLSGRDSQSRDFRGEDELIQTIVNDVLQKLSHTYHPSESCLVGIDKYCADIELLLQKSPFIGVWGVGGVGKTTIAKVIFNKLCSQYDNYCFFGNVREESETNGLNYIHNVLLSTLLQDKDFHSTESNSALMRLSRKKVLIVLDDINSLKQLEYLQQVWDCLRVDSRVIITTREKHVLDCFTIAHEIYQVQNLNFESSLQIFRLYAFDENHPETGYEEITEKLVYHAQGFPLTLKILGSFLHSKSMKEWKSTLWKLRKLPHVDIETVLSYDGSRIHIAEKLLIHPTTWKFVGFVSSASGLLCFAPSLSFQRLFGKWNIWKIFLYTAVSFVITGFMLLPKNKWRLSRRMWLKVHILSLMFVFTSLGSFFYENVMSGKPDRLGLSSIGLFSLSSLSLSRQIDIGFEVGFTNFLLATSTVQIMQINEYLVCLPGAIYFAIAMVRSYLESRIEETNTGSIEEHVVEETATGRSIDEHVIEEAAPGSIQEHVVDIQSDVQE